jgi:hypothetical protein
MQLSLFYDYQGILEASSFHRKYDALFLAFDKVNDKPDFPERGRKGYPRSAYLKALIFKESEKIKTVSELLRRLDSHPAISMMCGFDPGKLPDPTRFHDFLKSVNNSDIQEMVHEAAKLLIDKGLVTTEVVIGDSKPIKANTKHNNPKNPNRSLDKKKKIKRNPAATLGYYSYIKQSAEGRKRQFAYFWGYRTHVLVSKEGVVLVEITKPNNVADKDVAKSLMDKLKRVYGQRKGRKFIFDAAYDYNEVYEFIVDEMKSKPFIPINPRYKKPREKFTADGVPICEGGLTMKYAGRCEDDKRSRFKYRCPITAGSGKELRGLPESCPVEHEKFNSGKCYGCTAYVDLNGEIRRSVPRESKLYKDTYALRTEVERYFSRLGPREIEEMSAFKYKSVRNLMSIAHLTLNLTAVAAALVLEKPDKIRCYKTFADDCAA